MSQDQNRRRRNGARESIDRRQILGGAAIAAAGIGGQAMAAPVAPAEAEVRSHGRTLRIIDLTHELTTDFNLSPLRPRIAMHPIVGSGAAVGMNLNMLMLVEHTGTHIDVPRHFSNTAASLGELPIRDLVVPLAVIDIRARTAEDRNASVTVADIERWERRNGALPEGCCVAMHSGWDPLVEFPRMLSQPRTGPFQSPGFSPEAIDFMLAHRNVKGVAVDAMSIDMGSNGPEYPVHQTWLRSGRWGIEGLTNLGAVPAKGAILVVGAAPIKDATGIPIRALAIV